MLVTWRCTVEYMPVRNHIHAASVQNPSSRRLCWIYICVFMLVKGLFVVISANLHSLISVHLERILACTLGKNHILVACVKAHSLGNDISLVIVSQFIRVKNVRGKVNAYHFNAGENGRFLSAEEPCICSVRWVFPSREGPQKLYACTYWQES